MIMRPNLKVHMVAGIVCLCHAVFSVNCLPATNCILEPLHVHTLSAELNSFHLSGALSVP